MAQINKEMADSMVEVPAKSSALPKRWAGWMIGLKKIAQQDIPGTQMTTVFDRKRPSFGGLKPQNRGQTGSRL